MTGTANPAEPQQYAPEGLERIGRPPVNGTGGERGTSAFTGNSEFEESGILKEDVTLPSEGPKRGVDYYADVYTQVTPVGTGIQKTSRSSANAESSGGGA